MRWLGRWLGRALLAGLALLGLWLTFVPTPDTDRAAMEVKYALPGSRFIDHEGARLHWREAGCAACPPLLLLHGLGASIHAWLPLEAELGSRFRLISVDFPAHGFSEPRADDDYSNDALVSAVAAVARAAGLLRFTLVGHSLGGMIAWRYAAARPEEVSALILIAPAGEAQPDVRARGALSRLAAWAIHSEATVWLAERLTPRWFIEESLKGSVGDPAHATAEAVDRYWEMVRQPGNRRAQVVWANSPRSQLRLPGEVKAETLVIWGGADRLLPPERAARFAGAIPGGRAVLLEGVGHLPMEEAPARVAAEIDEPASEAR